MSCSDSRWAYNSGLVHSVLTTLNKKQTFFKPALVAVTAGFVLHVIAIVLRAMEVQYLPLTQRYEAFSFFGALAALGFLIAYAKYRIAPLSVFAFPVIFIMTFIANLFYDPSDRFRRFSAAIGFTSTYRWSFSGMRRSFIAFAAAIMYLIQERELKLKHPTRFHNRLPSLEVCDDLRISVWLSGFL